MRGKITSTIEGYREETVGGRYVIKGHGERVRIVSKVCKHIDLYPDSCFLGPSGEVNPYYYWLGMAKRLEVFKDYPDLWKMTMGETLDELIRSMKKLKGVDDDSDLERQPPTIDEYPYLFTTVKLHEPRDHTDLMIKLKPFAQHFEEYLELLTSKAISIENTKSAQ